ncbi:MAG: glycerophosphodiester phosphodiesterase [Candidatus Hydrogenedentota bacterium]
MTKNLSVVLTLALCVALAAGIGLGCQHTFTPPQVGDGAIVIAHRGASAYAPENTIAAFRLADEMHADWFELDCTITRDNKVVVIHDKNLERTTGVDRPVSALTMAELKELDAGDWFSPEYAGERLPTLGEALDYAKGRIGVYIEVKNSDDDRLLFGRMAAATQDVERLTPELRADLMTMVADSGTRNLALTRAVIDAVRTRDMANQVVIQSFSPVICLVALSEAPEMRVEMLASEDEDHPEHWPQLVRFAKVIRADGFNAHHESLTPERIADFHASGMTVAAWTVDEPARMLTLQDWGVDAIITNKPDVCRATLEAGGAADPGAQSAAVRPAAAVM